MELFQHLLIGLETAVTPINLVYCLVGVFFGTLVGVLPGLGPMATIAMLLPITFDLQPVSALIMLSGIYYGAQYGGSTTAILLNLPGEASSVITALDGHAMARKGRAGAALASAAIGSFVAGTIATMLIAIAAPPLAQVAVRFGAPEYFSLMALGLIASVVLANGSPVKAIGMIILGMLLGLIGTDISSGTRRFTFGMYELADGVNVVAIAMGIFGLSEVIRNLEGGKSRSFVTTSVSGLMLTRDDIRRIVGPILRGTGLGSIFGILPGGGAIMSSFAAYSLEKKISPNGHEFGKGAIEGVAAPESANNAGSQTSFIPMLTLGIPSNPIMALMIGALMIHGIQPGPAVMTQQPSLFWGIIVSMWIGNFFLILLNLPLVGLWARLLTIPYRLLFPVIAVFCAIGVFSLNNATFDVTVMVMFGALGYVFYKLGCEPAPLLMGFILGPMMEEHLRRAMTLSRGDPMIFLERPVSAAMLVLTVLAAISLLVPMIRRKREEVFVEDD